MVKVDEVSRRSRFMSTCPSAEKRFVYGVDGPWTDLVSDYGFIGSFEDGEEAGTEENEC